MTLKPLKSKPSNQDSEPKQKKRDYLSMPLFRLLIQIRALCGVKSAVKMLRYWELSKFALSIKTLPLHYFLDAVCFGSYMPNSDVILSQYYAARKDKAAGDLVRIVGGMEQIKFNADILAYNLFFLSLGYVEEIAVLMRGYYPQCKFTEDSYKQDCTYLQNVEKNHKIEYDALARQLEDINSSKRGKLSPDEQYANFRSGMLEINKYLQHEAITLTSTVYDFAIAENKFEAYIAHLEESNNKT